jgi:hypothetical protein
MLQLPIPGQCGGVAEVAFRGDWLLHTVEPGDYDNTTPALTRTMAM